MASIYLVRLGETENNVNGIWSGRKADSPLTPRGEQQSETVAALLTSKGIAAIYSSPSPRVMRGAQYLSDQTKLPIMTSNEFQEIDLGSLDGMSSSDAKATVIGRKFVVDPTGIEFPTAMETLKETQTKALSKIISILSENPEGSVAIFTHGGTMRLLILALIGNSPDLSSFWRFRIGNSAVAHLVQQSNEKFELQELANFEGLLLR